MSAECVHGQLARSCEICERDATIERLQQETLEQARLLGAGSEREARLMARVAELGRELTAVRSSHDSLVAQRAQSEPSGDLLAVGKAAEVVCAYDWSLNDEDAVAAIDQLCAAVYHWKYERKVSSTQESKP